MKTPAEIKKELRNAKHVQCMDISDGENECVGTRYGVLVGYVLRDEIYIYITQLESDNESKQKRIEELESRLAQVERENKAMLHDMARYTMCGSCKHFSDREKCPQQDECVYGEIGRFEWRGVCAENTEEDDNAKVD